MAKRVKPVLNVPVITTLEEADDFLRKIAAEKRQLAVLELGLKEQVDDLKKKYAADCEPILQNIAVMEQTLVRFTESKKTELFGKKRSIGLTFGTLGFRASSTLKTLKKFTWEQVLGLLKSTDDDSLSACIRVKQEVDKDALRQLPQEKLAEVGCRLEQTDAFYYELNEVEIAGETAQ